MIDPKALMILSELQAGLVAPKNRKNSRGGYSYRAAEDILEAAKPLLRKSKSAILLSDECVFVHERFYIKSTARLVTPHGYFECQALAREREKHTNKDGREILDRAQITGSASSYARKYALNGLLAIDDCQDADTVDNRQQTSEDELHRQVREAAGNDKSRLKQMVAWASGSRAKTLADLTHEQCQAIIAKCSEVAP